MAEESDVRIIAWPKESLSLQHRFDSKEPCPVSVRFEATPAQVQVATGEKPLAVDMAMNLRASQPVPLCISICEPICAKSDYTISFDIFDQPVGRILVRGITRLFNCADEPNRPDPVAQERCIDFERRKDGESFAGPVGIGGAEFAPVDGELKIVTWGNPVERKKLLFAASGVRINLPAPSSGVSITLVNYFGQSLNLSVLRNGTEIASRVEAVDTVPRRVDIAEAGITGLVVSGGGNEASVVELCWTSAG
jgi:hypothetical protein